jgi:hypothetical protein
MLLENLTTNWNAKRFSSQRAVLTLNTIAKNIAAPKVL